MMLVSAAGLRAGLPRGLTGKVLLGTGVVSISAPLMFGNVTCFSKSDDPVEYASSSAGKSYPVKGMSGNDEALTAPTNTFHLNFGFVCIIDQRGA